MNNSDSQLAILLPPAAISRNGAGNRLPRLCAAQKKRSKRAEGIRTIRVIIIARCSDNSLIYIPLSLYLPLSFSPATRIASANRARPISVTLSLPLSPCRRRRRRVSFTLARPSISASLLLRRSRSPIAGSLSLSRSRARVSVIRRVVTSTCFLDSLSLSLSPGIKGHFVPIGHFPLSLARSRTGTRRIPPSSSSSSQANYTARALAVIGTCEREGERERE